MNTFSKPLRFPFKTFILTFSISFLVLLGISELLDFLHRQKGVAENLPSADFVEEGKNFAGRFSNVILTNEGLSLSKNLIKNPLFVDSNGDGVPDGWAVRRQFYDKEKGGVVNQNNYPFKLQTADGKEISLYEYILPFTYQNQNGLKYGNIFSPEKIDLNAYHQNGEVKIINNPGDEEFFKRVEPVNPKQKESFAKEKAKFWVNGKWQTPGFAPALMFTASGKGFDGGHNSYFGPTVSQIVELPEKITERTRLAAFFRIRIDEAINGYLFIRYCFMDASQKPFFDDLTRVPLSSLEEIQNEINGKPVCIRSFEEPYYKQSLYDESVKGFMDFGFGPAGDGSPDYNKIPANARYLLITFGWYFNEEQWQTQVEEYKKEGKEYEVPFACKDECRGTVNINGKTLTYYHPKGRAFLYTPYLYIYGDDLSQPSMPTQADFRPFYAQSGEYISPPIDSGALAKVAKLNIERESEYRSTLEVEASVRAASSLEELYQKPFTKDYKNLVGRFFQYKLSLKEVAPTPLSLLGQGEVKSGIVKKVEIGFTKAETAAKPAVVAWTLTSLGNNNAETAAQTIRSRLASKLNPYLDLAEKGTNKNYLQVSDWKTSVVSDYYFKPGDTLGLVAWVQPFYGLNPKTLRFTILNPNNQVLFDQIGQAINDRQPRFYYLPYQLPATAEKGFYSLKVEVEDEKGNKNSTQSRFYVKDFVPTTDLFGISEPNTYPYELSEDDFNKGNFNSIELSHSRIKELGASRYREWLHFRESFPEKKYLDEGQIEPRYKKMLDYIVASAQAKDLKITANIAAYPFWLNGAEKVKDNFPSWIPEYQKYNMFPDPRLQPDLYEQFMKNYEKGLSILAQNYPYIDQWELDNEKDFFLFYIPSSDKDPTKAFRQENDLRTNVKIMADLYYYGRRGIKAGNPKASVVAPATSFSNYRYLEALYEEILSRAQESPERANPDNYFDFVSWHPYTEEDPLTNVTSVSPFMLNDKMYAVMQKYGDGEKLGIITEFGYQDTKPGLYEKAPPEKAEEVKKSRWDGLDFIYQKMDRQTLQGKIANFVLNAYSSLQKNSSYISSLMWFKLEEPPQGAEAYEQVLGFGLLNNAQSDTGSNKKPAALMYQRIATPPEIKLEKTQITEGERIKISGSALGADKVKFYLLPSLKVVETEIKDKNNYDFNLDLESTGLLAGKHTLRATKLTYNRNSQSFVESSPTKALVLEVVTKPTTPSPLKSSPSPSPSPYRTSKVSPSPSPSSIALSIPVCPSGTSFDEEYAISQWLKDNSSKLNQYGDPKSTVYSGGTPLVDEKTGQKISLTEYLSKQHPERPWRQSKYCKPTEVSAVSSETPGITQKTTPSVSPEATLSPPRSSPTGKALTKMSSSAEKPKTKTPLARAGVNLAYIFVASLSLSLLSSIIRIRKRGL